MLMKAYGITADPNTSNNFSDAGNTYYTGYLAAAKRLGISAGVGDNLFAPSQELTRQEMFTLLYNTLQESIGFLKAILEKLFQHLLIPVRFQVGQQMPWHS
jgi:hypothetical protein